MWLVGCVFSQQNPVLISTVNYKFDPLSEEVPVPESLRVKPEPAGENFYIVQFEGPVLEGWKEELEKLGVKLYDYINYFAFIVRATEQERQRVEKLPYVRWVGLFHPGYKLDPNLGKIIYDPTDSLYRVLVWFFPDVDTVYARKQIEALGGEIVYVVYAPKYRIVRYDVRIAFEQVKELAFIPEVKWVTPQARKELKNHTTTFNVQHFGSCTFCADRDTTCWAKGLHGEGQIIGICDTGLDYNHCAFRDPAHLTDFGPSHRKIVRNQAYGTGAELYDGETDGHGTHVAGTAAGDQSYITGSTWNNGIAYKAKISFADVCDCSGNFSNFTFTTILSDAYNDGARVHSNSWGYGASTAGDYNYEAIDADAFMWDNKDFLILFAAGNDGPTYVVEPPATAKDIVTVGATGGTDNTSYSNRDEEYMTDYSCPGPCDDGRRKPTVVAPGHWIASVDNDDGDCCPSCAATCAYESTFVSGTSVYIWTGTSMACPAAAGCAALVRQYFTEGWYPSGTKNPDDAFTPSAALIKAVLVNCADDMAGESDWPTMNQGFGRIDLDNALYFAGDSRVLSVVDETVGLSTGEADTYYYQVGSSEPLEITLVWTDHEAPALADPCIQNDLDLTVKIGGNTYYGNVFSGRQSTTGGSRDSLNVVEAFLLKNPPAAECTVIVSAYNTPYSPQPYALCVTGDLPVNHLPGAPLARRLFDNERMGSTTPVLEWDVPPDADGDSLHFRVQWATDADFSSGLVTVESRYDATGFSPTPPSAPGVGTCSYTIGSQGEGSLSDGTTYWWRVAAYDGVAYGSWSQPRSFTVNVAQTESDWFQTTTDQFETDSLVDLSASADALYLATFPAYTEELFWDDGGTECNYFSNPYYFACLFQPAQPCSILSAKFYVSRSSLNTAAACSLFVWEYSGTTPGAVVYGPVAFRPPTSGWVTVNLPTPYYDADGQFWLGAFFPNNQNLFRYLRLCSENNAPINEKTYFSSSRTGPWNHDAGYDDYIRAVVKYPSSDADSGRVFSTRVVLSENPGTPTGWDKVLWTECDGDSILVTVEYRSGGAWNKIADTATVISGTSGQLDISSLGTTDTIRVVGILYRKGGASPSLQDWAVACAFGNVGVRLLVGDASGPDYTEWSLGLLSAGETRIMGAADRVYVKNTGSVPIDISIKASPIAWSYSDAPGPDECVLMALFNGTTVPSASDFSTLYDTLGTNFRAAGTSPDGKFAGPSNDGVGIPAGGGEELYFYFQAPSPNTIPSQQTITVTIQAVEHVP